MEPVNKTINLLLVDDDEDDQLIIRKLIGRISNSPFRLEWIADAETATEAIKEQRHDIYLIDFRLGALNGLELLEQFDLVQRPEPFIILTGAGDEQVERDAMEMGVADYLVKGTFDAELLSRVLRYALQRKHLEQQRIQQLIAVNQSKDEFIALASHQLRTPATAVKQYVGMVLGGYAGDITEKQRELLSHAYDNNERQINVVNDILRVARLDLKKMVLKKKSVDLINLVEGIVQDQASQLRSRRQLTSIKKPRKAVYAMVDPEYFRMALSNIVDNASKYTPEGKNITISVTATKDGRACISIQDEGVGIAEEDLDKLFKKFSRIPNALSIEVGGTGLGLYWANEVIELHGGDVTVASALDKGTTFAVMLPLTHELPEPVLAERVMTLEPSQ